jgi:DNA-binding IclR family transcriptional regulator
MVRSAARVLDVLEFLAGRAEGVSLSAASGKLALPKSSTLMLLRTLLARGYVTRDPADRYSLNEIFRRHGFGWGGHRFARLIALAEPVMEQLCETVGETVLLGAAADNAIRTLAKAVARQDFRYDVDLDRTAPFYCTAMGRVIVAFSPVEERDAMLQASPLVKITPTTITDLETLHAIVEQTRQQGLAIVEEEFALGGTGIAAPIFAADGTILAALDIGCVTTRFQAKRERLVPALVEAARSLTQLVAIQVESGRNPDPSEKHNRSTRGT